MKVIEENGIGAGLEDDNVEIDFAAIDEPAVDTAMKENGEPLSLI
jgi:hypothetical protein